MRPALPTLAVLALLFAAVSLPGLSGGPAAHVAYAANEATGTSGSFGVSAGLTVTTLLGTAAAITVPPTPTVAGTSSPPYRRTNTAASVVASAPALGTGLTTGVLTVTAAPPSGAAAEPIAANPAATHEAFTARVVELTNTERAKVGLVPLTVNPSLVGAAQGYAEVLASGDCFAHTCGPVPELERRSELAGYTGWTQLGENIAAGYPGPEQVVAGWMASDGHRANILNPSFAETGVGLAAGGRNGLAWVQAFGAGS